MSDEKFEQFLKSSRPKAPDVQRSSQSVWRKIEENNGQKALFPARVGVFASGLALALVVAVGVQQSFRENLSQMELDAVEFVDTTFSGEFDNGYNVGEDFLALSF